MMFRNRTVTRPLVCLACLSLYACSSSSDNNAAPSSSTTSSMMLASSSANSSEPSANSSEPSANSASSSQLSASASEPTTSSSSVGNLNPLSDEFNQTTANLVADNSTAWQILHPDQTDGIDIGVSQAGALTILANNPADEQCHCGWFEDNYSALVFKNVTGNFAVMTQLRVVDRNDPFVADASNIEQGPDGGYNAGGFVIRDPGGSHSGDENWVMYNMGGQGGPGVHYAKELKKTLNSTSNLFLTPQPTLEEQLLVCRIGDDVHFYFWDESTQAWQPETFYNNVNQGAQMLSTYTPTGFSIVNEFADPGDGNSTPMYFTLDLPDTVQVGIIGHGWTGPYETRAEYDFVRFANTPPQNTDQCLAAFTPLSD